MNTNVIVALLKKNTVELILIISATLISSFIFIQYYQDDSSKAEVLTPENTTEVSPPTNEFYSVDISGAVMKPDVYEVTPGARIKDVIDLAGGFSKTADTEYVAKNFNLAKVLSDQEKIYIPTTDDTEDADFKIVSQTPAENAPSTEQITDTTIQKISINTASDDELDVLPGIGPTTAKKIIDNRPYSSIEELLTRKITSTSTYDKIKDLVEL